MADPIILDIFTLFGNVPPRGATAPGTDALTALMERNGVAGAVTLSTRGVYHRSPAGNRETAELCKAAGGALQPAAILDPRLFVPGDSGSPTNAQAATGARLLCLLPATQRWPLPFAPLTDLLRALAEAGSTVPIYFEARRIGDATLFQQIADAAGLRSPLLIGEAGGDTLIEAVSVARSSERVSLVTNGFHGVGAVALAVGAIGANRVLFGSGAPVRSLGAALALVRHAGLSPEDEANVLGANAKRLLQAGGAVQ